jgi:hypothetical protein
MPKQKLPGVQIIMVRGVDMINDTLKSIGYAVAPETAAATAPAADTGHPTHAEARHFAVYNHYRALAESSGSSGGGSQMRSGGDAQAVSIPGGRLFGIEQSVCPDGVPGK